MNTLPAPVDLAETVARLAASVVGLATHRQKSSGVLWRAGVRPGDRIVGVDQLPTPDVDTLHRVLGGERVGRLVRMDLLRGVHRLALDVVPDLMPDLVPDRRSSAVSMAK